MKILLLGSKGQLGSDILKVFSKNKKEIQINSLDRNILDVEKNDSIYDILKDIEFNLLINCTSYHKTDEVETFPLKAININSKAVKIMAQVCDLKSAKLIHISTDYVFSGNSQLPYKEIDNIGPINVYGVTKAMGENFIINTFDNFYILRVASLFGEVGASGKGGNFIETMINLAREKKEINVVNDMIMSPTSTLVVARNILKMIELDVKPGIYHNVNSGTASWYDLAIQTFKLSNIDVRINSTKSANFPTLAARPIFSVLDNNKLQKAIDINIPHWHESLKEYIILKGH